MTRSGHDRATGMITTAAVAVLLVAACSGPGDETAGAGVDPSRATASAAESTATTQGADPLLIETSLGPVQGANSAVAGVRHFLDIPFAEAPTGDLAWQPPVPAAPWSEPLEATEPGPSCPQGTSSTGGFLTVPAPDPDCLHLNVWAPDDAADLPVMVWIHGGSLMTGAASQPYYNGDDLAANGVVMVGINYRLGPQGFLVTEELGTESDDGAVGNYGLLDQQAALRWVQDNAAAFGGDPDNVTIFGESAGGFSACAHLASPISRDMFHKAIIQSGRGCQSLQPRETAERLGGQYLDDLGCTDAACLRSKTDVELNAVAFRASLVADGVTLTEPALTQAADGALDDIPVLIGANADEATLFTLRDPEPTDDELRVRAAAVSNDPDALLALYPPEDFPTNLGVLRAVFTDATFVCPTLAFGAGVPSAFVYHFTYVSDRFLTALGATHGFELAPLFAHPEGIVVAEPGGDADDLALSAEMQAAWTSFAATGDPGDEFEPYGDRGLITILDVPITLTDEIRDGRCDQVTTLARD